MADGGWTDAGQCLHRVRSRQRVVPAPRPGSGRLRQVVPAPRPGSGGGPSRCARRCATLDAPLDDPLATADAVPARPCRSSLFGGAASLHGSARNRGARTRHGHAGPAGEVVVAPWSERLFRRSERKGARPDPARGPGTARCRNPRIPPTGQALISRSAPDPARRPGTTKAGTALRTRKGNVSAQRSAFSITTNDRSSRFGSPKRASP
jgi:hypothetical protein